MPEKVMPGPVQENACIREAVCIHTKKIYDSCKEEDIALYILQRRARPEAGFKRA
jgi:phosphoribosyl-dephospho-CoA transferase